MIEKEKKFERVDSMSDKYFLPKEAYDIHKQRGKIKLIHKYRNSNWILAVRENRDYDASGSELIKMTSTLTGNKMKVCFENKGLFEK